MYRFGTHFGGRNDRTLAKALDMKGESSWDIKDNFQVSGLSSWLDDEPFSTWSCSIHSPSDLDEGRFKI